MALRLRVGILILFVAIAGATVLYAEEPDSVNLLVGRSTVINVGTPISRVSLTSPDVADALVTSSAQLLLHGKTPGTISMFVWDRAGAIKRYDVVVQRDLSRLSSQVLELFPGEQISVQGNGKSVIVSGTASSKYIADKALEVAAGYVEKKDDVVNLVQVQTRGTNQVLLKVRFAEVSRSALTELGASIFTGPEGYKDYVARATTQQFPSVNYTDRLGPPPDPNSAGKMVFSDLLNVFLFNTKYDMGTLVKALQSRGLFQSLAEPNLVAESGKEASFLAGGEIPVPIAQGTGGNVAISVMWKEFGIRLNFTPTVNGDRVHLKVKPEVSTLDFNNSVVLQGFRIPALSTRRADTEIELQDRQTFAIAGLLNNTALQSMQKVAGLGDIPILGYLFKSKAAQKDQTELVVMITPEILAPNSFGVTPNLPKLTEPYLGLPKADKVFPQPPPAFQQSTPAPPGGTASVPSPSGAPAPAVPSSAAADISPRTKEEQKKLRRQQSEARERELEQQKRDAKMAEKQAQKDREQAKRDEEVAKKAAEVAKRQAEIDRERQKEVDAAAAKLKAAEDAYQAELAKRANTQSPSPSQAK